MQVLSANVDHNTVIPVDQIAETKRAFRDSRIDYEVLIKADRFWDGLADCSAAFAQAGLTCRSLRYGANGMLFFRLADCGADLARLAGAQRDARSWSIVSWSTVLGARGADAPA